MIKYIKVEWPDSQKFQKEEYNNDVFWAYEDMIIFVPEELYYKVME